MVAPSPYSHPDCWASALRDCSADISEEHLISVAAWRSKSAKNNRAGRKSRMVNVQLPAGAALPSGLHRVSDVTDRILCRHHNNTSSPLDQCSGSFRDAIDRWRETRDFRLQTMRSAGRWWQRKQFERRPVEYVVDGPLLERWFIKTVINGAVRLGLPIGDSGAATNRPTLELCEIVFGQKNPPGHIGLYAAAAEGDKLTMQEEFSILHWDVGGTHIGGALMQFRTHRFAVNLVDKQIQQDFARSVPEWGGMTFLRPLNELNSGDGVKTAIRFKW
jgi:hypothetical protein